MLKVIQLGYACFECLLLTRPAETGQEIRSLLFGGCATTVKVQTFGATVAKPATPKAAVTGLGGQAKKYIS